MLFENLFLPINISIKLWDKTAPYVFYKHGIYLNNIYIFMSYENCIYK